MLMIYALMPNRVRRSYRGGERIDRLEGENFRAPVGELYPEDWTASVTRAVNAGRVIKDEGIGVTEDGLRVPDLVGEKRLPLLVKLLDSAERLVVQAHPTVPFAKKFLHSDYGKTECWYFLECDPDAAVYLGFRPGITREKWAEAFERQSAEEILSLLHRVPVKKGDFIFVAGGVPHAIGGGSLMIELQEPSDLMVVAEKTTPSGRRIDDYKMDMGLGKERMLDVYDYRGYTEKELKEAFMPREEKLSEGVWRILGPSLTNQFSMYRFRDRAELSVDRPFGVAIVTEGEGRLCGHQVRKGQRYLIEEEKNITLEGEAEVIFCI